MMSTSEASHSKNNNKEKMQTQLQIEKDTRERIARHNHRRFGSSSSSRRGAGGNNNKVVITTSASARLFFSVCVLGYMFQKHLLRPLLLPYGPAMDGPSEEYANIDYTNDLLQMKHGRSQRLYERIIITNETTNTSSSSYIPLLNGPETVLFDKTDGSMYVMTEDAKLIRLDDFQLTPDTNGTEITARTTIVKNLGPGRPLGGVFTYSPHLSTTATKTTKNNKNKNKNIPPMTTTTTTLYICDAILGLTRVVNVFDPKSKVEIVASHVMDDVVTIETYKTRAPNNKNYTTSATSSSSKTSEDKIRYVHEEVIERKLTPIMYANDVTVGPRTGMIYFTDSTNIPSQRFRIKNPSSSTSTTSTTTTTEKKEKKSIPKTPDGNFKALISSELTIPSQNDIYRWDTLYASKMDLLRRGTSGSGRLLRYNPIDDTVQVLARGLHFPNGISVVDENEDALFVAETFGIRLYKYNLTSERLEVLVDSSKFPGYVDGADCIYSSSSSSSFTSAKNTAARTKNKQIMDTKQQQQQQQQQQQPSMCYAVMPSSIPLLVKFLNRFFINDELNRIVRTLVMTLPRFLLPSIQPFGGLVEVNMDTNSYRFLLDPKGIDMQSFTGVTHYNNKLYFGSIKNNYIGIYNLQSQQQQQQQQQQHGEDGSNINVHGKSSTTERTGTTNSRNESPSSGTEEL